MKEIGKEKKIAIAALIVAVLMLTVAFAAMSRTLKINGTAKVDSAAWDIHFKSAEMKDKKGDAREVAGPVISEDGINLTLKVGLRKPKDEITYEAIIENKGDIDAEIESIEYPNLTEDQAKIIEFEATYANGDAISKSQELKAGNEKTVKIVIRYKDITDESLLATNAYDVPLTFKINYIQKGQSISFDTESTPEGGEIVDTETSPYIVTKDGVLLHYERQGDETSLVVPAEVNGIKIKTIATSAFFEGDLILSVNDDDPYIIGIDPRMEEIGEGLATDMEAKFIMIDDYLENQPFVADFNSGDDKMWMKAVLDFETNEIIGEVREYADAQYLKNLDLSNMSYLEVIGDWMATGVYGSEDECPGGMKGCILGKLESIILPENGVLTIIGDNAFENNKLTTIELPSSLTTIGQSAFHSNGLTGNLTIPANVISIDKDAFEGNNLTTVTVLGEPKDRFDSNWSDIFDNATRK